MALDRRGLLTRAATAALPLGLAGCAGSDDDGRGEDTTTASAGGGTTDEPGHREGSPELAVAGSWNVYRTRVETALGWGLAGQGSLGAAVAEAVVARFETAGGEWGAHERLEETSHEHYEGFEHGLEDLRKALSSGKTTAAKTAADAANRHLAAAQEGLVDESAAQALELEHIGTSAALAYPLAVAGHGDAAETVASRALETFEAASVHGALEAADHDVYERFEDRCEAVGTAASSGETATVRSAARQALAASVDGAYAVGPERAAAIGDLAATQAVCHGAVCLADRGHGTAATEVLRHQFERFETARVHETLEHADHATYEAFEHGLEELIKALKNDGDVESAETSFADATRRARFAVAGALSSAPGEAPEAGHGNDSELSGGPNVVEGVPEDADHVVAAEAVAFAPETLSVSVGDTVAFEFAGGEPHTVTALEGAIPDGAAYWASGGFDSESAAREGWEHGAGAVQSGESYVHTFETAGTHEYVCIPHEAAGMTGAVEVA